MSNSRMLHRAIAARLLLDQEEIQEAFEDIEEDMKSELFALAGDNPSVSSKFREIKSFQKLKERLQSYASSEKTHKNYVDSERRKT